MTICRFEDSLATLSNLGQASVIRDDTCLGVATGRRRDLRLARSRRKSRQPSLGLPESHALFTYQCYQRDPNEKCSPRSAPVANFVFRPAIDSSAMLRSSLLLSLVFGFALSEGGYSQWSPETYPNSMRDLQLCGLQSPSYVCDPNDLLEDIDGQSGIVLLEKALLELRNSTNCTCSGIDNHVCGMTPHGFTVSIAVVEKMKLPPGREDRTSRTEAILQFADDLRIRLPRGQCDDDLFIVISVNDSAIWTSTGPRHGGHPANRHDQLHYHDCRLTYAFHLQKTTSSRKNTLADSSTWSTCTRKSFAESAL
ncbi:hypothetical protein L596_027555 [Steinernema carpocapsae]|uniref:Uncharacterized protein n=1 Tax=Steinernema carpocapsae TaxID=34508 RepID=A0A4V5ZXM2_STECR|nr:hypothetical protein L596_027555 [Steinernema carpocapsae]